VAAAGRLFRAPHRLQGVQSFALDRLPVEVFAGLTLAALVVPLNIGYAQVAGLPPLVGLYAGILPPIVWALLATTRHVVVGPDAAIAALLAGTLGAVVAPGDPRYFDLVLATTLACGVIFLACWLFRLGFLADFLSHAVLVGFITGLGIEVLLSQIEKIMAVHVAAEGFFREVWALALAVPSANGWSVALGIGSIAIVRILERWAPRLPGALIALAIATVAVSALGLEARGVAVLGPIEAGLPSLTLPGMRLEDVPLVIAVALAICAATLAEGPLLARRYAERDGEPMDADQDLFAFGAANVAAAATGSLSIGSSASRTAAMDSVGSRTQIPSIVAGVVVAVILVFFTDLLAALPTAALAGIVANAVVSLIAVAELRELWRVRRSELAVAVTAVLGVLVLGVLYGVLLAFLLSVLDVVWRASRPPTAVLAMTPAGDGFEVPDEPLAVTRPGLVVYRFAAALYFANANLFLDEIRQAGADARPPVRWLVLDASSIRDIDMTGARALRQAIAALGARGITMALSHPQRAVLGLLARYELEEAFAGRVFATNRDAVTAFERAEGRPGGE
jgi:SulP family sulfate permease